MNQHYIPRFILRNFALGADGNNVNYFDNKIKKICLKDISEIFCLTDIYEDTKSADPNHIENDLAKFESEVAPIISRIINAKDDVELTIEENDKLALFVAILAFRSKYAKNEFMKKLNSPYSNKTKTPAEMVEFWRENLGYIVKCRNVREVLDHPKINNIIKMFICRDASGFMYSNPNKMDINYFIIVDRRGKEDFVLGDYYPYSIDAVHSMRPKFRIYSILPLTPSRALILANEVVSKLRDEVKTFPKDVLIKPFPNESRTGLKFHIRKIYED
ncbi:MAG: DUF4238 domain-containing protein, partial [Bacilli bacterium]|nr:DUF4238 domain-containing protein [Bacilli bacterium]